QIADYGVRVQPDPESAVMVAIPPTWNLVLTTILTRAPGRREQLRLESALGSIEAAYPYTPSGVFTLLAYGLPYFHRYIDPAVFPTHLPRMTRAVDPVEAPVLIDAIRFPSDPSSTLLEANEVVFHLRSDVLANLDDIQRALFGRSGTLAGGPAPDADLS